VEANDTRGIAWGDRDGDGDLDLATAVNGGRDLVYANAGVGLASSPSWFAEAAYETAASQSVAWGDRDGDGDLDLVIAVADAAVRSARVHENEGNPLGTGAPPSATSESDSTHAVAWGDWDGDGDLDLAAANYGEPNRVYRNDDGAMTLAWSSVRSDWTYGVAWGDQDGDGDLDLAVGNYGQPNRLYRNNGGSLALVWFSPESDWTVGVAWGDWDGDGDLDLAVANDDQENRVYENDGGTLKHDPDNVDPAQRFGWVSTETDPSIGVAWGDWDNDLDLDLAFANWGQENRVYENDGLDEPSLTLEWSSSEIENTYALAWGDADGDGDLDLAVANNDQANRLYANDGLDPTSLSSAWTSPAIEWSYGIAWGDWDNDGDLDLAVGNWGSPDRIYRNNGGWTFDLEWSSLETGATIAVAWGDPDNDGDLDLATGNWNQPNEVYRNGSVDLSTILPETPVHVVAARPGNTHAAYFHSSAEKLDDPVQIPFTLFDAQSDRAWEVVAEYSTSDGGQWTEATEATGDPNAMRELTASPEGAAHTFSWNASADNAKNEDDVVFRFRVLWHAPGHAGGPIQRAEISATTPPFRVGDPVWYLDGDGDTHGDPAITSTAWDPPEGYVARGDDCDDGNGAVYPGAAQLCDGVNNDCNHASWPALAATNEHDDDGDTLSECAGDCDDTSAATYPGAPEVNDGFDNQCPGDPGDGMVDEITGDLVFQDKTTLTWPLQGGATQYEVERAGRADFETDCWSRNEFPSTNSSLDTEEPLPGTAFFYLLRAYQPNPGSWGRDSADVERSPVCN
jgi:hypothetical protein